MPMDDINNAEGTIDLDTKVEKNLPDIVGNDSWSVVPETDRQQTNRVVISNVARNNIANMSNIVPLHVHY